MEDEKLNTIRFMCAECDGGWRIQLGHSAGYLGHNLGWYLESDAISSSDIGTYLMLKQGESYIAPVILSGSAEGGMDEAIEAMTRARKVLYKSDETPLMFNDYMDCLWCNVNDEITEKLTMFARNIGLVFQVVDDVLDVTSTNEVLGKNVGSDKDKNKSTFMKYFTVEEAREYSTRLTDEAISYIEDIEGRETLIALALYLCERNK